MPLKPPAKSPDLPESMMSPCSPISWIPPASPRLPSKIRALNAAESEGMWKFKLPKLRPGVKVTYAEASHEPMDIENYYAVEKVNIYN